MPKALLFDLDGTLSNTDAVHFSNWIEILRPYGVEVTRELYEEKLSGRVDREAVESVLPDLPGEEVDELLEREELRARQRAREVAPPPGCAAPAGGRGARLGRPPRGGGSRTAREGGAARPATVERDRPSPGTARTYRGGAPA